MGLTCSKCVGTVGSGDEPGSADPFAGTGDTFRTSTKFQHVCSSRQDSPDPAMYDLMRRSVHYTTLQQHQMSQQKPSDAATATILEQSPYSLTNQQQNKQKDALQHQHQANNPQFYPADQGQFHLLYKHQKGNQRISSTALQNTPQTVLADLLEQQQQQKTPEQQQSKKVPPSLSSSSPYLPPTRLLVRRHSVRHYEEGMSGTHIYAMRYPADKQLEIRGQRVSEETVSESFLAQEQAPQNRKPVSPGPQSLPLSAATVASAQQARNSYTKPTSTTTTTTTTSSASILPLSEIISKENEKENVDYLFLPSTMATPPKRRVTDWVTVSAEHNIYVADVGLSVLQCDQIVQVTEQVCRGQYAAYTYAKQTLGCREFPSLAAVCQPAVHTIVHAVVEFSNGMNQQHQQSTQETQPTYTLSGNDGNSISPVQTTTATTKRTPRLALDDREPHMVKYDVTKKERQKLDMHTDKSEWTFLISLSNGCGMDYEGGGTYFECLDATVHIQRGHALIFPGKLRHCGQRITAGLRFLLVGFLVDKSASVVTTTTTTTSSKVGLSVAPAMDSKDVGSVGDAVVTEPIGQQQA